MSELGITLDDSWGLSVRHYLEKISSRRVGERLTVDSKFREHFRKSGLSPDNATYATVILLISGGYLEEASNLLKEKCSTSIDTSRNVVSSIYYDIRTAMREPVKITLAILAFIVPAVIVATTVILFLIS